MLVIAVLAVIASISITTYRSKMQTNRANKVALEMQQVLQAAQSYYSTNTAGEWPANNANLSEGCDPSTNPDLQPFVQNYLPNANTTSSYGDHYCWAEAGDNNNALFWVAVKVPGNDVAIAKRIAALLPNAVITNDPAQTTPGDCNDSDGSACYVRAEVTKTGVSTAVGETVAAVGVCPSSGSATPSCRNTSGGNFRITFDACKAGTTPVASVSPNFIFVPTTRGQGFTVGGRMNATVMSCTSTANANGQETCDINVHVGVCTTKGCDIDITTLNIAGQRGSVGASYAVFCKPASTPAAQS